MTTVSVLPSAPLRQARILLALGLPLVGSQVAQMSAGVIDTLMLGRYDLDALAGSVLANSLFFMLLLMGSGFAFAVTPLVAAAAAQGDAVRIRRITRMGLWASLGFAVLAVPVLLAGKAIFLAIGQDPVVAELGGQYLSVMAWGLPPALAVMLLRGYLAGLGRTRIVLWVTLGGCVLNAGLDWLLIFGRFGLPELGVRGAALASTGMNLAVLVVSVAYALRAFPEHALFVRLWRPDWAELAQVLRLGWPIGVASLAEAGLFSAASVMIGWAGPVPLAAHGVVMQLVSITFMLHLGLSQAATILAGRAYGQGDWSGLRGLARVAVALSLAVAAGTVVVLLAFRVPLIDAFLDPAAPAHAAILRLAVQLLFAGALFQTADGLQVVMMSLLRGVQDTQVPMGLVMLSYWGIGVPLAYVLSSHTGMGALGVWIGLAAGLFMAAGLLSWRFWSERLPGLARRPGGLRLG